MAHGGIKVDELKDPIEYLENKGLTREQQRYELDMLQKMNRASAQQFPQDPELDARIQAFELAFRMQTEAPEAFDIDKESEATKKLYGMDDPMSKDFGWQCLMARRLAQRGVRFIQINHEYGPGNEVGWDAHSELIRLHTRTAKMVDKPISGLLKDLKAHGLLKDTLVVWGGEFGRTPISQAGDGRDHNPYGYSMWMAGAGVKAGQAIGTTDEIGLRAVDSPYHVHDIHATILHTLGLNHERTTYLHNGRAERPTLTDGKLIKELFA